VFGIVDHNFAVILQKTDCVSDHRQIFVRLGAQNFGDVQQPCLAHDRYHRRFGIQDHPHQIILLHRYTLATGHAESRDLRVLPFALPRLLEKFHVLRIRPRPAAFNVINPEGVQPLRNAELVDG
jgi:hypothetical protein